MHGKGVAVTCVSSALVLALGLGMAGCADNKVEQTVASSQQAESTSKADELRVIGVQKDGTQEIEVKNCLGSELTAVSLRTSGEQTYQDNLVVDGGTIAKNETVRLFVDVTKTGATYDIRVTKENGGDVEFLSVPVSKIATLALKESDGKGYVDYVGLDKQSGTTKEGADASVPAPAAPTSAPNAPAQTEDTCLPDVVLR